MAICVTLSTLHRLRRGVTVAATLLAFAPVTPATGSGLTNAAALARAYDAIFDADFTAATARLDDACGRGWLARDVARAGEASPHACRVLDLVFESSMTLVGPDSFALSNSEGLQLISCRRAPERPQPDALPEIGGEGADALLGASSVHEMVGNSTTFRLTHREVKGIDYLQEPQSFVAAGAVAPLASGGFLVCELNRYAKPEALPRFRRFLASARPE